MLEQLVLSTQDPHPTLQLFHLNGNQIKGTVSCDRADALAARSFGQKFATDPQLLHLISKEIKGLSHVIELVLEQLVLSTLDPHRTLKLLHLNKKIKRTVSRDLDGTQAAHSLDLKFQSDPSASPPWQEED